MCPTLVLAQITRAKASADLVVAAKEGDLATVQDCLAKKADIETKSVRSMFTCDVVSGIDVWPACCTFLSIRSPLFLLV